MDDAMMSQARRIARGRSEHKRKAARQAKTTFGKANTHLANTLLGVQGEMVVAKYTGGIMDINVYEWADKKPGDVFWNGWWIEVKACQMFEPDIKAFEEDKDNPLKQYDFMVGVSIAGNNTRMFGWCTRAAFYANNIKKNYGHGPMDVLPFAVHEAVLLPMSDLLLLAPKGVYDD
jgi:hypothetical protein